MSDLAFINPSVLADATADLPKGILSPLGAIESNPHLVDIETTTTHPSYEASALAADPDVVARINVWSDYGTAEATLLASSQVSRWASVAVVEGLIRWKWLERDELADLLGSFIPNVGYSDLAPVEFEAQLDPAGAMVLAALLDIAGDTSAPAAEVLRESRPVGSPDQMRYHVAGLISAAKPTESTTMDFERGIAELIATKAVTVNNDTLELSFLLQAYRELAVPVNCGLSWNIATKQPEGIVKSVGVVPTSNMGLSRIDALNNGRIGVSSTSPAEVADALADLLLRSHGESDERTSPWLPKH